MGTAADDKCLDYNYNNMNVYMHPCHGGANQKWVHPQRTANAAAKAPPPPPPPPPPAAPPAPPVNYCAEGCVTPECNVEPKKPLCATGYTVGPAGWSTGGVCLPGAGPPGPPGKGGFGLLETEENGTSTTHGVHGVNTTRGLMGRQNPPGELKTEYDSNCLDYNYNDNNVYMHPCHGGANQQFYFTPTGELKTQHDDKCLDYNYGNGNVYMHPCHGGTNQKWHINPDGSMGTQHDAKCLDYNYNSMNVYMHDCHGGSNQKWVHPQRTLNAEMPQPAGAPAGELKTEYDDNCLDYNYNDGNVYMHPCHGG